MRGDTVTEITHETRGKVTVGNAHPHQQGIDSTVGNIKNTLGNKGLNRDSLKAVLDDLIQLAGHTDWLSLIHI